MVDIDHFKTFNDTYGHLTGDQVLRLVASSLKQNVKGQDVAARYGGEEFAVVLPNTSVAFGADGRRPYPPGGDVEGIDEALHRTASRTHYGVGRCGHACTRATPRKASSGARTRAFMPPSATAAIA